MKNHKDEIALKVNTSSYGTNISHILDKSKLYVISVESEYFYLSYKIIYIKVNNFLSRMKNYGIKIIPKKSVRMFF